MKQVVQIRCKNNKKTQKVANGSTLSDIFSSFNLKMEHGPVSAKVNNKVEGMHYLPLAREPIPVHFFLCFARLCRIFIPGMMW